MLTPIGLGPLLPQLPTSVSRVAFGTTITDFGHHPGLLPLMLLTESRMPARRVEEDLVLLRDQDRGRWDLRLSLNLSHDPAVLPYGCS
jgi:hypothetical protein